MTKVESWVTTFNVFFFLSLKNCMTFRRDWIVIALFSHKVFKKEWRANLSLLKRILGGKLYVVNCISSSRYYLLLMVNWRSESFFQVTRMDIILECMFSLISVKKLLLSTCCKDAVIHYMVRMQRQIEP